jgi:N-acetyldiaminopimelate deacetylase
MKDYVAIRRQLHQIPEPGYQEFKTQQFLLDYIQTLPQDRIELKTWRTGILVRVKGTEGRRCIAYRADMDGLPISEETSYDFKSKHEGFMHACGHDVHMTIGLGVLTHVVNQPLKDDILVLFQPAEEGPGGALPMMQSEEFREWTPDMIMALHIAPEYPVGTIATRPGILFANTSELYMDLKGTGGHAAFPHKANDMMIAAANLILQLQTIVSRNVDPLDSAVITLGKIEGGIRQNVIAEKVRLEGTIRTLSASSMDAVKARLEQVLSGIEASFQCETAVDYGSNYHQVYNHENLVQEFMSWVRTSSDMELIECPAAMTGEDFGYFLKEIPGFMFWLGVDTPYGLHHSKIEPNETAISRAIETITSYMEWKSEQ